MTNSKTQYPDNLKIIVPDAYLIAIGKVCVQWGQLETIMALTLRKLTGIPDDDPRSLVMVTHLAWPLRMEILEALVRLLETDHPHLARFDEIKPLLKKAQGGRNRIMHAQWGPDEKGQITTTRATARGTLKFHLEGVAVADIEAIVDDIGRAAMALWKLLLNK